MVPILLIETTIQIHFHLRFLIFFLKQKLVLNIRKLDFNSSNKSSFSNKTMYTK